MKVELIFNDNKYDMYHRSWEYELPVIPRIGEEVHMPEELIHEVSPGKWDHDAGSRVFAVVYHLPTDEDPEMSVDIYCDIIWERGEE